MTPLPGDSGRTDEARPRRRFSEEEIRRVARYVALLKVATERGYARRSQLRRLLTPQAYDQQFHPDVSMYPGAPRPTSADLGGLHVAVTSPQRSLVAVATRQTVERWGALLIDLRVTGRGRLLVADLVRAHDRHLSTQLSPPELLSDKQRQREVRELLRQRRIAREMTGRLQSTPGPQGHERSAASTVPPPGGWDAQLRRLDLRVGRALGHLSGESAQLPAHVLGNEPAGGSGSERWRHDYEELLDFRGSRLGLDDEHPAVPTTPAPRAAAMPQHLSPPPELEL